MRRIVIVAAICLLGAFALAAYARRSRLPAAERGRRLAERVGCFSCHGPGGTRGAENPGRVDKSVPGFEGDVMMYAKSPEEIREWILDGVTGKRAASVTWQRERERGALRMPAFKGRLGPRDVDDLAAYVLAATGSPEPEDSLAALGLKRAEALGCVSCHGPGGRLARTNPGSFKGYVPSWDGPDFAELVLDSTEFRQWVEDGVSHRFRSNPAAMFFLRRGMLRMPAYSKHLDTGDAPALWEYVRWLRSPAGAASNAAPRDEERD